MASRTTWVPQTSFLRAMLLQPKRTFEDVGTVQQGLGDPPPPPVVQSCVTSPKNGLSEVGADGTPASGPVEGGIGEGFAPGAEASKATGNIYITGGMLGRSSVQSIPRRGAQSDRFRRPRLPCPRWTYTYEVTITYDWWAYGHAIVVFGAVAIVSDRSRDLQSPRGTTGRPTRGRSPC